MNYTEMVSETWRHSKLGSSPHVYRELVRYATLAASSHNTQPWIFKLEPNQIQVLPDLSRRCPAVDPDDHHLYASLGCATENLLLAARAAGLKGDCRFDASKSGLVVDFEEAEAERSALFEAIPLRQCIRSEYDGVPLTPEELELLQSAGEGEGVSVLPAPGASGHRPGFAHGVYQSACGSGGTAPGIRPRHWHWRPAARPGSTDWPWRADAALVATTD
ncbi:hypothetical protein [Marinobacter sp. MIT932201]|uniref:hypothetical protein n=1 Tax=Marinobacter sp. MIT932201 TaxID=3096995 RepID=UPI00399ABD15|tara:strand:- start:5943 stop:6599 length:657 start_codon:yes stop_codon:yes gene_type:complete